MQNKLGLTVVTLQGKGSGRTQKLGRGAALVKGLAGLPVNLFPAGGKQVARPRSAFLWPPLPGRPERARDALDAHVRLPQFERSLCNLVG